MTAENVYLIKYYVGDDREHLCSKHVLASTDRDACNKMNSRGILSYKDYIVYCELVASDVLT